jgi:cytochrome c biogenesis protein CcmG/thiol:disulfide interchange protein DsbE
MKKMISIKKWMSIIISIVLILGMLSSCKTSSTNDSNDESKEPTEGVFYNNIALNFTEHDSTNALFDLNALKGKVILLNFSAMWCGPCRNEASQLMELYNTYKERGLEVVQCIFQDEDGNTATIEDINRWLKEFGLSLTIIFDSDLSTVDTYKVGSIPLNLVIDRDFKIIYRMEGFDKDQVILNIEKAL